jgi:glycine cleavage system regulatory protein
LRLELVGLDRPGIVREISSAIAERGVNVERARVAHEQRADVGRDAIPRRSVAAAARDGRPDELRSALEKLANEMMVELSLDHEPVT